MIRTGHRPGVQRLIATLALTCLACSLPALAFEPDAAQPRSAIPTEYQWSWDHIFDNREAWEQELSAFEQDIPSLTQYKGRLSEGPHTALAVQDAYFEMLDRYYRLRIYGQLRFDIDMGQSDTRTDVGVVTQLAPKFSEATSWIQPELIALGEDTIESWMQEEPKLKEWEFYFSELFRQKQHTLTEPEERLMSVTSRMRRTSSEAHQALLGVDIEFPTIVNEEGVEVPLTLNNFSTYRSGPSYAVRKQAAEGFFGTLRGYETTFAVLLNGVVQNHLATKDARDYESCLEASLDSDHISPQTYKNLVETVRQNLPETMHKYVDLRRKVLGIDGNLDFANLYNALLEDAEAAYTYAEGRELIARGLEPLGTEYVTQASHGMDPANGWTDVYPNEDKRSGAYSNGALAATIHPYVLQNFDNTLDAVFTTAHEYGHAMHSFYAATNQPPQYRGYTTFLAEIASTCNEALVTDYMLDKYKKDVDMKLLLLNQRLESMRLTIFRQTLFADFELQLHQHAEAGNPLTAEWLNDKYKELITLYYGPNFEMAANDECEWMFIPHFYYNFYVFTYATGLTSGLALAQEISENGQQAADRYVENMLKGGSSAPPLDLLRQAGVDLETPAPIQAAMDLFAETVAEFEKTWEKAYGDS